MAELQIADVELIWDGKYRFDITNKRLAKDVNIVSRCVVDMTQSQVLRLIHILYEKRNDKVKYEYKTKKRNICYHVRNVLVSLNKNAFPSGVDLLVFEYIDFNDYVKVNFDLNVGYCSDVSFQLLMYNPLSIEKEDEWMQKLKEMADRQIHFRY